MTLNSFLLAYQDFNGIFGIIINLLLLALIVTEREFNDRGYKTIMMIITGYNIYYSILHTYLKMEFIVDSFGFLEVSTRVAPQGFLIGYLSVLLYVHAFTCSVLLLALHCLYRYVRVTGQWSFLFDTTKGLVLVFVGSYSLSSIWMIMVHFFYQPTDLRAITVRDELMPILGNLNTTEWSFVGPLYWYKFPNGDTQIFWTVIIGSMGVSALCGSVYAIVCATGFRL